MNIDPGAIVIGVIWAGMAFALSWKSSLHSWFGVLWGILAPPFLAIGVVLGIGIWKLLSPAATDALVNAATSGPRVDFLVGFLLVLPGIAVACLPLWLIYLTLRWLDRRLYPKPLD